MTTNTKTPQKVAQRWSIYFNDTKDATTMVNLAHIDLGPMKNKPNLVKVSIKMNNPRDTGFSSETEDSIFINMDIENAIKNLLITLFKSRVTLAADIGSYTFIVMIQNHLPIR